MILETVFVRFYKSFNFDYLRKASPKAKQKPWELLDGMWYPYVRIPIDPKVTTVVGANESGKSHLLSAIEKGLSGTGIERQDFCRYSQFFTVEQGKLKMPDFGFEWARLTPGEVEALRKACPSIPKDRDITRFLMFRQQNEKVVVFLPNNETHAEFPVENPTALQAALPRVFHILPDVALPESVPIRFLAEASLTTPVTAFESIGRQKRLAFSESVMSIIKNGWFSNAQTVNSNAQQISTTVSALMTPASPSENMNNQSHKLAFDLICKVARVDQKALADLYNAIRDGKEGHVNGLVDSINQTLETSLNFPHWWAQDKDFKLTVSAREYDLVFTIRDKTGTDYSFTERSGGLKYFLSYYVQYRAHVPTNNPPEILLMDEPDAYLSSQAQQDLLKIFNAFASPEDGKAPVQVIYVTHSPFLIDKNHSERIRVLEKGAGDEGTRVVRDASRNHYEPLRSAFGAFVAETTFIGNCNLMVEGPADQILLAGMATQLQKENVSKLETLDLNNITIVPAGSASHLPYMVYLARGRDVEQPAVVVMCDNDAAGNDAVKKLKKHPQGKRLIDERLIFQMHQVALGEGKAAPIETEDLIPEQIAVAAARRYAIEFCGVETSVAEKITAEHITAHRNASTSLFKAIEGCFETIDKDHLHVDKVGFARCVMGEVHRLAETSPKDPVLQIFVNNMRALFKKINNLCREAERQRNSERVSKRVEREKKSFLQDHPSHAKKEEVLLLFESMESVLDETSESDSIRIEIMRLKRDYQLESDLTAPIQEFKKLCQELETVRYAGRIATQEKPSKQEGPVQVAAPAPVQAPPTGT